MLPLGAAAVHWADQVAVHLAADPAIGLVLTDTEVVAVGCPLARLADASAAILIRITIMMYQ